MSDPKAYGPPWPALSSEPKCITYEAYYMVKATELGAVMEAVVNLPDLEHVVPRLDKDALIEGVLHYTLTVECRPRELDLISFVRHAEKIGGLQWVKRYKQDDGYTVLKHIPRSKILESVLEHAPVEPKEREKYLERFISIDVDDGNILRMPARGDKPPHEREADEKYEALLDLFALFFVDIQDKETWRKIRPRFEMVLDGFSSALQRRAKFSELHVIEGPDPYGEYEQD